MATYRDYAISISPTWLRNAKGEVFMRSMGDVKDSLIDRTKAAVMVRFPSFAPDDGLARIGDERQMPRSIGETRAQYASRLRGAWDAWKWAGTPTGLLRALWWAGYQNCMLVIRLGKAYSLDGDLNVVVTDLPSVTFTSPLWNTFRVFFPSPLPASWVSGGIPSTSSDEANGIRNIIRKWKPAFARCESVVIYQTGLTWGYPPTLAWGGSGLTWGGTFTEWTF